MADIIIVVVLGVIVFLILRSQFRKLRRGQCSGGCSGCPGCQGCSGSTNCCGGGLETPKENIKG